jgi:hypothetical protein
VRHDRRGEPRVVVRPNQGKCSRVVGWLLGGDGNVQGYLGLWVKGSGGDVGHVEKGGKIGPKGGNKLGASVGSHGMGNTKTGNPSGAKSISTGTGGRGRKRNSLDPACGPINDGENVGITLRRRKGSYEINMNVGKTAGRNRNRSRWWRNVFVNLGSLARNTLSGPEVDVMSHTVPKEARSEKTTGGSDTRMT